MLCETRREATNRKVRESMNAYRYEVDKDYGTADKPDDKEDVAAWLRGDVWSVSIIDNETGELVDFDYPVFGEANAHASGKQWLLRSSAA